MTKDVLISLSGVQLLEGDTNDVELITAGDYYNKNGKHYIRYEEIQEGGEDVIQNTIKIHSGGLDIIKKGSIQVHMAFEKNKKNTSCYMTPFGEMLVEISTNDIVVDEQEDNLKVTVDYSLDVNYEHMANCNIVVDVRPRAGAALHLQS